MPLTRVRIYYAEVREGERRGVADQASIDRGSWLRCRPLDHGEDGNGRESLLVLEGRFIPSGRWECGDLLCRGPETGRLGRGG